MNLRHFTMLVFLVPLISCSNSLPPEAHSAVETAVPKNWFHPKNLEIQLMGVGTPLPEDMARGAEEIYCINIKFDHDPLSDGQSHTQKSLLIFRIGRAYDVIFIFPRDTVKWKTRSCPGEPL